MFQFRTTGERVHRIDFSCTTYAPQIKKEKQELAKSGIVSDLEAKAKELGFNSFAEGVEAYNKQNGTNYTVEEAKKELGH